MYEQQPIRVALLDDQTIGMFLSGQWMGRYDEDALDLAENVVRIHASPSRPEAPRRDEACRGRPTFS